MVVRPYVQRDTSVIFSDHFQCSGNSSCFTPLSLNSTGAALLAAYSRTRSTRATSSRKYYEDVARVGRVGRLPRSGCHTLNWRTSGFMDNVILSHDDQATRKWCMLEVIHQGLHRGEV